MTLSDTLRNPPPRPLAEWPLTVGDRDYELAVFMDAQGSVLDTGAYLASLPAARTPEERLLQRLRAQDAAFRYPVTIPFPLYYTLRTQADSDMPDSVENSINSAVTEIFQKQVMPQLIAKGQPLPAGVEPVKEAGSAGQPPDEVLRSQSTPR